MPTPTTRATSFGLLALLVGGAAFAACDVGDDTVYPNPLVDEGEAGKGGASAGGAKAGSGGRAGSGDGGATNAGASGASGTAGSAGMGGAAGTGAGFGGSAAGSGGSGAGFGGSTTFGGSAGLGGTGGASGSAGASGAGGGGGSAGASGSAGKGGAAGQAGAGAFDPSLSYDAACEAYQATLQTSCKVSDATLSAVKKGCAEGKTCANKLYRDGAPSQVLSCLAAACSVPAVLPSASDTCLELAGTAESRAQRDTFQQDISLFAAACQKSNQPKAAQVLQTMGGVHGFYRAAIYSQLGDCLKKSCDEAIVCLKDVLSSSCDGFLGADAGWFWPTDAVITNATKL